MRIGEVSRRSGVSVRMLRHYDKLGLVVPSHRSAADYREYSPADVRRLLRVESLRTLGMPLAQVARALDDPAFDAPTALANLTAALRERIDQERDLLNRLEAIGQSMHGPGLSAGGGADENGATDDLLQTIALINILRGGDSSKRQQAALRMGSDAAGRSDDRAARSGAELARAYLDEPDENAAGTLLWALTGPAAAARSDFPDTATVRALAAAADHPDAERRARAVRGLAGLVGLARPPAGRPNPETPETAALGAFLDDADPGVRVLAAIALGRVGRAGALAPLVASIAAGHLDVEAAETAAALDPRAAVGMISLALGAQADPAARLRLVQALGELPADTAQELLISLASDPDPAVARIAEHLLRR